MYNHFLSNYGAIYDWVLFIDVDEFLVLKNTQQRKKLFKGSLWQSKHRVELGVVRK